jgi:dUTP pyrophosphatase
MSSLNKQTELAAAVKYGCAILKVSFCHDADSDFVIATSQAIASHNKKIMSSRYPDSGFDLKVPNKITFNVPFESKFINLGIKTSMTLNGKPSAFNVHPRSSISKTPLMLANHTGIIDSGYRGPLIAAMRYLPLPGIDNYVVEKETRLVQVCHPSLCPIYVIECSEEELSTTERGSGGFGSTGI